MPDLQKLLYPKSIALIGASNNPKKVGGIVLKNLLDRYKGKIFLVNPTEFEINGLKCYSSVKSLPELPDLAIIAIPVDKALLALEELGQQKIKNILIFSAGFKEMGEEGIANENKLLEIAEKYQLNIIGPNCLGFLNNNVNLNATFGEAPEQNGNLKILSQSGAIATSFFDWAQNHSLGLDQFITLGNKSVLNENHFLEFWLNQNDKSQSQEGFSAFQPIGMYLESISDGQEFLRIVKKNTDPIFILKPGKSPEAANAMKSHTGSLAGADDVLNQALNEANIIRANTLEDFFDLARALSWENAPSGPNVAIISNAGGPGVISADAVANSSLKLATISQKTIDLLARTLPRSASLHNPIDVLGDALSDRFGNALEAVLSESEVDAVIVILTPQIMTQIKETAQIIGEKSKIYPKPVYCSFIGGSQVGEGEKVLNDLKIPNFNFPENAIKIMSKVYSWSNNRHAPNVAQPSEVGSALDSEIDALLKPSGLLDTNSANQVLDLLGLDTPSSIVTSNFEEANRFAEKAGFPLVLKTTAEGLLHKSDSGGVMTNIDSFQKLKTSWVEIQKDPTDKIQIQKQIKGDLEIILGFKRDSVFGDTFFFGAGGKLVNLFHDKNLALFPLDNQKILHTLEHSQIYPLLTGYRNTDKLNVTKLIQDILKLSNLFSQNKSIREMEINPVIINTDGVFHVDPKIILEPSLRISDTSRS